MHVIGVRLLAGIERMKCGDAGCQAWLDDKPHQHDIGCMIRAAAEWGEIDRPRVNPWAYQFAYVSFQDMGEGR